MFFINVPVGIAAIILALLWFPKRQVPAVQNNAERSRDLDPVGTILLGLAVLSILLPFVESNKSTLIWLGLPLGLALLAGWAKWEHHYRAIGRAPMVDLAVFRVPSFRSGTLFLGLYFFGMSSIWIILNLYFQDGLGHSALAAGLLGLPSATATGLVSVWAGRKVARYGRAVVVLGIYLSLLGIALSIIVVYLHSTGAISEWWLLFTLAIFGIGGGAVVSPNQTLTLEEVPLHYAGSSGGVMQTAQQVGASIGLAVITAITFAVLTITRDWSVAFMIGLAVIGIITATAQIVAYTDLRRRHREAITPPSQST